MEELLDPLVVKGAIRLSHENDPITIFVGWESKPYHVNRSPLLQRARDFHMTATSQANEYRLHSTPPATFELYKHYISTGELACESSAKDHNDERQDNALVEFYVLAANIDDRLAMHAALRAMLSVFKRWGNKAPSVSVIRHAYNVTVSDSPLRKLLVDLYIWDCENYGGLAEDLPPELERVALQKTLRMLENDMERLEGSEDAICCDYQELDDELQCPGAGKKRKRKDADDEWNEDDDLDFEGERY